MAKHDKFLKELNRQFLSFTVLSIGAQKGTVEKMIAIVDDLKNGKTVGGKGAPLTYLREMGVIKENNELAVDPTDLDFWYDLLSMQYQAQSNVGDKREITNMMDWRGEGLGGCIVCGNNDMDLIDFHHIDPKQEGPFRKGEDFVSEQDVSQNPKQRRNSVFDIGLRELCKTVPLCKKCHNDISVWEQEHRNQPLPYHLTIPRERLEKFRDTIGVKLMASFHPDLRELDYKEAEKLAKEAWDVGIQTASPPQNDYEAGNDYDFVTYAMIRDSKASFDRIKQDIDVLNRRVESGEITPEEAQKRIDTKIARTKVILEDEREAAYDRIRNTKNSMGESLTPEQIQQLMAKVDADLAPSFEFDAADQQPQVPQVAENKESEALRSLLENVAGLIPESVLEQNPQIADMLGKAGILSGETTQPQQPQQEPTGETMAPEQQQAEQMQEMPAEAAPQPEMAPPVGPGAGPTPGVPPMAQEEFRDPRSEWGQHIPREHSDRRHENIGQMWDQNPRSQIEVARQMEQEEEMGAAPPAAAPPPQEEQMQPTSSVRRPKSIHEELKNNLD